MNDVLAMRVIRNVEDLRRQVKDLEEQVTALRENQSVLTQVLMELLGRG